MTFTRPRRSVTRPHAVVAGAFAAAASYTAAASRTARRPVDRRGRQPAATSTWCRADNCGSTGNRPSSRAVAR